MDYITTAQLQAAQALSSILKEHNFEFAFIGGFAVNLLGEKRSTEDIDAIVIVRNPTDITTHIRPLIEGHDSRFSVEGLKLYFTSSTDPPVRVTVEMLPAGTLGLPLRLDSLLRLSDGTRIVAVDLLVANMSVDLPPVLHPAVLILTKIKRWATLSESTRPRSVAKARMDLGDITFLLHWLGQHGQKIDLTGYGAENPERLMESMRQLVRVAERKGWQHIIDKLYAVTRDEDLEKLRQL